MECEKYLKLSEKKKTSYLKLCKSNTKPQATLTRSLTCFLFRSCTICRWRTVGAEVPSRISHMTIVKRWRATWWLAVNRGWVSRAESRVPTSFGWNIEIWYDICKKETNNGTVTSHKCKMGLCTNRLNAINLCIYENQQAFNVTM